MKRDIIQNRQKIQALISQTNGFIKLDDVQKVFDISRERASFILWRLVKKGWVKKLKSGLYRQVPLESSSLETDEHPWNLANELYSPCYIGGWSAANFWGLTDQLFIKTWVMTTQPVHKKISTILDHKYMLKGIKKEYMYGLKTEWLQNNKILISDPHKTVIDFLNFFDDYSPQSMVDILESYVYSEFKNFKLLKEYAEKTLNKAVFKRLGFLLENICPQEEELIRFFQNNISKGHSYLSNKSLCTRIVSRWNLKVPENLKVAKND